MVTEGELKSLLSSQGWTLATRKTGKQMRFDAKKHLKKGSITRYIAVTSTLGKLTEGDVLGKLKE
jgi:hypothetical protein